MHSFLSPPARQLRKEARAALSGKWGIAVLAAILASMLGVHLGNSMFAACSTEFDLAHFTDRFGSPFDPEFWPAAVATVTDFFKAASQHFDSFWQAVRPALLGALITLCSFGLTYFVVGSSIQLGLARFQLSLTDGERPSVALLFFPFKDLFFRAMGLRALRILRIALWSLLLIVPGIIASYRYAMTSYIMAENPHMTATEVLRESARMMKGNKWRLFCLQLSFFGYRLLSLVTFGLAELWVAPYVGQAKAHFYHHISGRSAVRDMVEELSKISEGL